MLVTPYKKKDGKTYYKVQGYLGTNEITGKKVNVSRSGFTTAAEAKKEFARLLLEFDSSANPGAPLRIGDLYSQVYHDWLNLYKETVKESTFFKTKRTFENHILPMFGSSRVKVITLMEAQRAVNSWSKDFVNFGIMKSYSSNVLDHAIRLGMIESNPFDLVLMPKRKEEVKEKNQNYYDKEELQEFLALVDSDHEMYSAFFHLLAYTGIRKGEALALTWEDLNSQEGTLTINKTVTLGEGYKKIVQTPKTSKGERAVNLDSVTVKKLKEWRLLQQKQLAGFGFYSLGKGQLMFPNNKNDLMSHSGPTNYLNRFYRKHKDLRVITAHGLRHTHCSLLFEAGASIKEVQDRLGHSDIHTTMNIYAHVTKGKKIETANKFLEYMSG